MTYPAWKGTCENDGVVTVQVHTNKDEVRNFFWLKTQENDLPLTFTIEPIQMQEVPE